MTQPGSPAAEAARLGRLHKGSRRSHQQQLQRRRRASQLATQAWEREHGPSRARPMLRAAGLAAGHL